MDILSIAQGEGYKTVNSIASKTMESPSASSRSSSSGYQSVLPDEVAEQALTTGLRSQANITLQRSESMPADVAAVHTSDMLLHRSPSLNITSLKHCDYDPPNASMSERKEVITLVKCESTPSIPSQFQPGQFELAHSPSVPTLALRNYDVIFDQSVCSCRLAREHDLEPAVLVSSLPVPSPAVQEDTCVVCLVEAVAFQMPCCSLGLCITCLYTTIEAKLDTGVTSIVCPNPSCESVFEDAQIRQCLSQNEDLLSKYSRFKVAHSGSQTERLCPFCSHVTVHRTHEGKPVKKLRESDVAVTCEACEGKWCFFCHAPWHASMQCADFKKGNKLFSKWLKQRSLGTPNAQRCPKCAIPIQRTTGCDNMHCTNCRTNFCYACGELFKRNFVLGTHYKQLSIYGCKARYRGSAFERESMRYGYLLSRCTFLAAYPVVFIGAVVVVSIGGLGYLAYKGARRLKKK